jgi:hypothetical protein
MTASDVFKVADAERQRRLDLCDQCPEQWGSRIKLCRRCGCVTAWKTQVRSGKCPLGKW